MKILIDADGCPVKQEIVKIAKEFALKVIMIKNISHEIADDYAEVITVDQGRDTADILIVNHSKKNDIVVTQDYGLAALALAKGANVINQDGWLYTNENIDELLMKRHIHAQMRRKHKKYSHIPKRTKEDNQRFIESFQNLIEKNIPRTP